MKKIEAVFSAELTITNKEYNKMIKKIGKHIQSFIDEVEADKLHVKVLCDGVVIAEGEKHE